MENDKVAVARGNYTKEYHPYVWEFYFHVYCVKLGAVLIGAVTFCFGGSSALTVASLCI